MSAGAKAAGEPRRDGAPPVEGTTRGGLRGVLDRLSPRNGPKQDAAAAPPRGKANKIRGADRCARAAGVPPKERPAVATGQTARDQLGRLGSPSPRRLGSPSPRLGRLGSPSPRLGGPGDAEAHELLARAVCEAVRRELQGQLKEATCALQDAVRSEVSAALSASPTAGAREQALAGKPSSGEVQEPLSPASQDPSPVRHCADQGTLTEERTSTLSKFAEGNGKSFVMEDNHRVIWFDRLNYFWSLKEPQRDGQLASFFQAARFEVAIQMVIMAHCVFMALVANSEVACWDTDPNPIILPLEIFFQVIYTLELIGKLSVHRLYFFWNQDWALNSLDFTLVVTGAIDIGLRLGRLWNLTYLRSLRIVKVAKALRLVRVVTGASELRKIFICIIGSLMNFVWSIVMLGVVLYMVSLGLVMSAGTHLNEMSEETSETANTQRAELTSMYGSVQTSMLTLYKATTGGDDWSLSYNVISSTGWTASMVYLLFVAFMQIALVNIITGIFVDTALQKLAPDREAIALRNHTEKELVAEEMRSLWREVSETDDGYLSLADFYRGISGTKIQYQLEDLGLSVDNVAQFFCVLRNSSPEEGRVRISNFVHGCMRLKGPASSYDLQEIRSEVVAVGRKVDHLVAIRGKSASSSPSKRCGVEV